MVLLGKIGGADPERPWCVYVPGAVGESNWQPWMAARYELGVRSRKQLRFLLLPRLCWFAVAQTCPAPKDLSRDRQWPE